MRDYLLKKVGRTIIKLSPSVFYDPLIRSRGLLINKKSQYLRLRKSKNKTVYLHRYITGAKPGEIVDHINRNKLDNRTNNLRIVSARQNVLNRLVKNTTGFIGVSRCKLRGKSYYRAVFKPAAKRRLSFSAPACGNNLRLCALARDRFVILHGDDDYAPLNFPDFKHEPFRTLLKEADLKKYKNHRQ